MSNHDLRDDTECQNCGHTVEHSYCGYCGQKNTETRQSFAHLAAHFAEDLTHYDSGFWRTIKYLLFRPAKLTQEYLIGRRQAYVPPVKLYIFISFVTFFLMSVLPNVGLTNTSVSTVHNAKDEKVVEAAPHQDHITKQFSFGEVSFSSVKELEKYQDSLPQDKKYNKLQYWLMKKTITKFEESDTETLTPKFMEALGHNFPKMLFIYMPIFAFWLWLFHSKKRWYFFDAAIFTLHYFSLMLLLTTIVMLIDLIFYVLHLDKVSGTVSGFLTFALLLYTFVYFYVAHKKMYHEGMGISVLKSTALFFINFILMGIVLIVFAMYTFFNLH